MEFETLKWAIGFAFVAGTTFYSWYSGTQRATKDDLEVHGRKIAAIEVQLQNMPSQESFHKLQLDVVEMRGEQRLFSEQLKPLSAGIARIEKFLLDEIQSKPTRTRK
jgi:Protein of unknown function (DUF2730)